MRSSPPVGAIAVVQKQDHLGIKPRLFWPTGPSSRAPPRLPARPVQAIAASIVIPTRGRPAYLEVALASIAPQARAAGAEVLVIDDAGPSPDARAQAQRFGARYEPHERELGLNVARNTGVERSTGELVVFVDDDIEAGPGWLAALLTAASEHPDVDVFAGPIRPRLEGRRTPRSCGREGAPITTLELGAERHRDAVRMGCEHGDQARGAGAGGRVRRVARARRRRAGVAGPPARRQARGEGAVRGGRRGRSPPHGTQTRGCVRSCGPSTRAAERRGDSTHDADRRRRCRRELGRWRAAWGTWCAGAVRRG